MINLSVKCLACRQELGLKVCQSAAGFYLGHWCSACGPHDRQSGYYGTREAAGQALAFVSAEISRAAEEEWGFENANASFPAECSCTEATVCRFCRQRTAVEREMLVDADRLCGRCGEVVTECGCRRGEGVGDEELEEIRANEREMDGSTPITPEDCPADPFEGE